MWTSKRWKYPFKASSSIFPLMFTEESKLDIKRVQCNTRIYQFSNTLVALQYTRVEERFSTPIYRGQYISLTLLFIFAVSILKEVATMIYLNTYRRGSFYTRTVCMLQIILRYFYNILFIIQPVYKMLLINC